MIERQHEFEKTLLPEAEGTDALSGGILVRHRRLSVLLRQLGIIYDSVQQKPDALFTHMQPGRRPGETEIPVSRNSKLVIPNDFYEGDDKPLWIEKLSKSQAHRLTHYVVFSPYGMESQFRRDQHVSVQTLHDFAEGNPASYLQIVPTELKAREAYKFVSEQVAPQS